MGIPAKVVRIVDDGLRAEVEVGGVKREIDLTLVPEAKVDDYVVVHVGFAIQRIDEARARETLALMEQMIGTLPGGER